MNEPIWFKERKAIDMRTNETKKTVWMMLIAIVLVMLFMAVPVEAKAKKRLTSRGKTLSVGQEYKLKLKGLSKNDKKRKKRVSWKISDKSVVVFKGKTRYGVTVKARKTGTVKVTGTYKGKKYSCKIKVVGNDDSSEEKAEEEDQSQSGNAKLNASEIDLYYLDDEDRQYITQPSGHSKSFQFKVSGVPKDEIIRWSIEKGKKANCYRVMDNGNISLSMDPSIFDEASDVTVIAKLENGTKLKATIHGYSERGIAVKKVFEEFKKKYITSDMTQYEKMETIAKYVEQEYDYVLYQSDWRYMVISGGGDCFSSRYFVKYLCESVGIKALACIGEDYHGQTLVKSDGKMYIVVTGFNEPQPRRYMIMELTDQALQNVARGSRIDLSYFD